MKKHKIEKIEIPTDAVCGSADTVESYREKMGEGGISPNVGYVVIGFFLFPPKVGETMNALREERNGVKQAGLFSSSRVVSIEEEEGFSLVKTQNSVYKVTEIK
jgi:hypothetical protein|tara:strand:+ start:2428 stop:2739 length:312 start_codon:yes stop_codon:yes gene_type:complete